MSSLTKYHLYGPRETLKRMPSKLFEDHEPRYLYSFDSPSGDEQVHVALYEQYEKQINATVSLICIIESTEKQNRIELKKSGGRMGFRGSSLSEEKKIESDVVDFIMDFSKRYGLTLQEEVEKPSEEDDES